MQFASILAQLLLEVFPDGRCKKYNDVNSRLVAICQKWRGVQVKNEDDSSSSMSLANYVKHQKSKPASVQPVAGLLLSMSL